MLGPLSFLINTNYIVKVINEECKRLLTDDSNIWILPALDKPQELKHHMTNAIKPLFKWFDAYKITVNVAKTQFTILEISGKTLNLLKLSVKYQWKLHYK